MDQKNEGANPPGRKNVAIARIKIIAYSSLFLVMFVFVIAIFAEKLLFS